MNTEKEINTKTIIKSVTAIFVVVILFFSVLFLSQNMSNVQIETKHKLESDNNTVMIMQALTELKKDGVNYGEKTTCMVKIQYYEEYTLSEDCYTVKTEKMKTIEDKEVFR